MIKLRRWPQDYPQEEQEMTTTIENQEQRPVMTLAEVSKYLGCDPRTVGKAVEDGTIKSVKIGKRVLVLRAPLEQMLRGEA